MEKDETINNNQYLHDSDDKLEELNPQDSVKAYRNVKFLNSRDARTIRILAEYLEPESRLRHYGIKDTIVFYGSARIPSLQEAQQRLYDMTEKLDHLDIKSRGMMEARLQIAERDLKLARYYEDARKLAYQLTKWALDLDEKQRFIVCSGGGPGIMEAANRGAAEAGGKTIGFNISLPMEQGANPYITKNLSFDFHYFFMRKLWFVYTAKALVVFPGGFGTFDELFELLTLRQTKKVKKPLCVIIYGKEYWESVMDFNKMVDWGVINKEDLNLFHFLDDVEDAYITLRDHFEKEFVGKKQYWHW
ncbi:MAG TPA: TIGR00730 family Rossman fold protein [bacterium]|nr:TIGR00730 family Rossman fold protein [bacterium]HPN43679.1 TIGR00730 family Rossman fold protein [bacterium]